MKNIFITCSVFLLVILSSSGAVAQEKISLHGKWRIALDGNYKDWPIKSGFSEKWFASELPSNENNNVLNTIYFRNADFITVDSIYLPGSTDEAQIGTPLKESSAFTPGLERKTEYDGAFWVQRKVVIPENWRGKKVFLFLERLLGGSQVFWDGNFSGENYGFAFPHKIQIDSGVVPGEHLLTILVNKDDNRYQQYGHHVVNGNGTSWNGLIGRIELQCAESEGKIDNVSIFPEVSPQSIKIKTRLNRGTSAGKWVLRHYLSGNEFNELQLSEIKVVSDTTENNFAPPVVLTQWSEFSPVLYSIRTELWYDNRMIDSVVTRFGMREIGRMGGNITINGEKVFLRGTLDNGESPLTGYPAMDKLSWLKKFEIFKEHGVNLVRFHTWCPPEAAFEAADELGIYLQPELCGSPYSELDEILEWYGNHPSFCLLSLNNEAFSHNELTRKIITEARSKDIRHLYTCTTHPLKPDCSDDFYVSAWGNKPIDKWPFAEKIVSITWGGGDNVSVCRFNQSAPETMTDYSEGLKGINAPVISHEAGQWAMFPDFSEIDKFTGVLRNTNYERFKKKFEKNILPEYESLFAFASGKFSALLYKEEIESALRTPGLAGIELLGLRDFPGQGTAITGILNVFNESKGLVSASDHRKYFGPVVPLARLNKRVYLTGETFTAGIDIANYSFNDYPDCRIEWSLKDSRGNIVKRGSQSNADIKKGMLNLLNNMTFNLDEITAPERYSLTLTLPSLKIENSWNIWVYPAEEEDELGKVVILTGDRIKEAEELLNSGMSVLLILTKEYTRGFRESCFAPVFWNSLLKWPQKAHTLGIYCDSSHPLFSSFPTENYCDWQWWDVLMHSNAVDINKFPREFMPIISSIDSYHLNNKLALLFECRSGKGKLMVSFTDLTGNLKDRPASRQLRKSILNYMNSTDFNPKYEFSFRELSDLILNKKGS